MMDDFQKKDLAMMRDPFRWPMLMLPLKRAADNRSWLEYGVLRYNDSQDLFYFYRDQNLYEPLDPGKRETLNRDELIRLVKEGWEVD